MGFHSTLFNQTLAQNIDVNGQKQSKDLEYNYIECFTIIWATRWPLKQIFNQIYYEKESQHCYSRRTVILHLTQWNLILHYSLVQHCSLIVHTYTVQRMKSCQKCATDKDKTKGKQTQNLVHKKSALLHQAKNRKFKRIANKIWVQFSTTVYPKKI